MALLALIKRLQDIMRNDAGVGGDEQRLSQIIWILFLKVFDDKEKEWEFTKEDYKTVIPEGYRWRDWATSTSVKDQMTGEELIDFINNKLFKVLSGDAIKNEKNEDVYLFTNTSRPALLVKEFMKESSNFMKNGVLLRQVINEFDEIDFNDGSDRHAFNDVYETLLKGLQKNNGEFFTPRAITTFVTDKVNPQIGEKVADFACGTGGFLVDALEHMKKQKPTIEQLDIMQKSFYGVEKKQLPYMLCATNMMLHDIEEPDILHGNSLEQDVRKYTDDEKFDVILMNPPYGGSELEVIQKNFPAELRNSETADLFVIEMMYRLNKNGRCGVVLPDGIMFGSDNSKTAIKKKLLGEFNLHTVIRLPESCFAPYTSITTNLLFFDNKGATTETWFYRFDLPERQKFSMKKNPIKREDFSVIDEWWDNRVEIKDEKENNSMTETWKARKVPVSEIISSGYSLDFCGFPNEEKVILSPEEVISNYIYQKKNLENKLEIATSNLKRYLEGDESVELKNIKSISDKIAMIDLAFPDDMKNALLQAAMQGKLTEQLDSDSSVDELIDKCCNDKKKAIEEGKYRKERYRGAVEDSEDLPCKIPMNWRWVYISDMALFQEGPGILAKDFRDSGVPLIRIAGMKGDKVSLEGCNYLDGNMVKNKWNHFKLDLGDIVISTSASMDKIAEVQEDTVNAILYTGLIRFKMYGNINKEYFKYFIKSPFYLHQIDEQKAGGTIKHYGPSHLKKMIIPLPPIEEQQRIVERLEQLLPLCETE